MSSRNRNNYIEHELTDDEDSGSEGYMDDMRSFRGRRESSARSSTSRRTRRNSTQSSIDLDEDCENLNRNGNRNSVRVPSNRDRRAGSLARSVQSGWSAKPATKSPPTNRNQEPIVSDRIDRRKVDSPSQTQDSESEPGTKALVQAKIREKLAQQSSLDESSSDFWKPKNSKNPKSGANKFQSRVESESQTTDRSIQPAHTISTEPITEHSAKPNSPVPIEREKSVQVSKPIVSESIERDILQIIEQDNINVHSETDVGPIGPPPSAPEYDWECEFCTFVNEAKTKICTICCKTPMSIPQKKLSTSEPLKSAEPPVEATSPVGNEAIRKSTTASSSEDTNKESNNSNVGKSKGKFRKISFWPGTKST